jgi:hypothetical protein
MTRERLADRRRAVTDTLIWKDSRIHTTAGFTDDGRLLEVFIDGGGRIGSETDHLLDDVAVTVSRSLQCGDRLADLAAGLGRLPGGEPATMIGAIVNRLVLLEATGP